MSRKQDLPDSETGDLDLFECLPVGLQQKVARGEVDLNDLLELLTRPDSEQLCPQCAVRTVPPKSPLGLCKVCTQKRSTEAHLQVLAELEAQRENNAAKQKVCRERRLQGTNPRIQIREEQVDDRPILD